VWTTAEAGDQDWFGPEVGHRYLTHRIPPPDRALSAVGGGAVTPGPAPCTGVAVAGSGAFGEDPDVAGAGVAAALVVGLSRWRTVAWISGRLTKLTSSPSGSVPKWSMGKV
jgi:hypothetical protein